MSYKLKPDPDALSNLGEARQLRLSVRCLEDLGHPGRSHWRYRKNLWVLPARLSEDAKASYAYVAIDLVALFKWIHK